MIYYLKHNIHKLNWTMIGNVFIKKDYMILT